MKSLIGILLTALTITGCDPQDLVKQAPETEDRGPEATVDQPTEPSGEATVCLPSDLLSGGIVPPMNAQILRGQYDDGADTLDPMCVFGPRLNPDNGFLIMVCNARSQGTAGDAGYVADVMRTALKAQGLIDADDVNYNITSADFSISAGKPSLHDPFFPNKLTMRLVFIRFKTAAEFPKGYCATR